MSRHWEPPRRPWTKADAFVAIGGHGRGRLPPGARTGLLLVAAACVALGILAYEMFGPREIIAHEAVKLQARR